MKIITSLQSKHLDKATIEREPISSIDLMERAGKRITKDIFSTYGKERPYRILCGNGNNGGDGLVIARLLHRNGCKVTVYIDDLFKNKSAENRQNLMSLEALEVSNQNFSDIQPHKNCIWIDALFGSGLTRSLDGKWKNIVQQVNHFKGTKIAIDIPSGLSSNDLPTSKDTIFKADKTYAIGQPKLTFFLPESATYVGTFEIINICLNKGFLSELDTCYHYSTTDEIRNLYKPRKRFSHKGTFGHSLIIAGSYGKIGAALLATKASLKVGAGLVTSYIPLCGYEIMQQIVPEAMCITDNDARKITEFPNIEAYNSIALGCGLGQSEETQKAFYNWIKQTNFNNKKLVIDADGLNLLSKEKQLLHNLPSQTVLTPHPKEFERLTEKPENSLHRLTIAQEFAKNHSLVLVLKDSITCVINSDGQVYFNSTGNAGLATGGSGDTLTGVISGLMAQGYSAIHASRLGVWLHGKCAEIGLQNESEESFTASDINKYIGKSFKILAY